MKEIRQNTKTDAKLGIYLIALVLLVIVIGYWLVVAGKPQI